MSTSNFCGSTVLLITFLCDSGQQLPFVLSAVISDLGFST